MSSTTIYKTWKKMRQRCQCKTNPRYAYYGGRGIFVCDRWQKFENFYIDMGDAPTPQHSIERINNDGPYEPSNCRWATKSEQAKNTRRSVLITYNSETRCIKDWADLLGMDYTLIRYRLRRGWTVHAAFTIKPILGRNQVNHRLTPTQIYSEPERHSSQRDAQLP